MAALLAALLAALVAGCAPGPLLTARPDDLPTAHVPIEAAGIDDRRAAFAALFRQELRATGQDAPLAQWLHGVPAEPAVPADLERMRADFEARRGGTSVLLVPGLFGDCVGSQSVPFGDGVPREASVEALAAYDGYRDLGLASIRMVTLPGRASTQVNGERLAQEIRLELRKPGVERLVLVGYSKGAVDALQALDVLDRQGGVPRAVVALVSVAGAVMGTPLADRFEGVYGSLSPRRAVLGCSPSDGEEVSSLTRRERVRWMGTHPAPPGVARYTVVAHARTEELAAPLHLTHHWLSQVDPHNDGQMLAIDAMLPGSTLLATARSDHWDLALPRDRHPNPVVRGLSSGRGFPREALFRALLRWVIASAR